MSKQNIGCLVLVLASLCVVGLLIYQLPPVNDRLDWRVDALQARIKYAINPPEQAVFQPQEPPGEPLPAIDLPTASPATPPSPTSTIPGPTPTPEPTATPTPIPTPIPPQALLTGITHMYQMWNNCGPANLAMALSYWGWKGDQRDTAAYLKPNKRDKNVMPYEMESYVADETELLATVRIGGDIQILKNFVAAGFPVIVEKGFEGPRFDDWMGHYEVINGYDDTEQVFFVQDSYDGPNLEIPYADMLAHWRAFNYTYIVTYPQERQSDVLSILGPQADPTANYRYALQKAIDEASTLTERDLFFTWFNRGSALVNLKDYQAAATAFDAAFANYRSIPEDLRPWRMMWYNTYPYWAYYYTGRYQDVIDLADTTLATASERILEESFYWRGMAKNALGDTEGAIADFKKAVEAHPGFIPAVEQLQALGINP